MVEPYEIGALRAFHFDLYRLVDPEELEYMGIRDYFDEDALCLIEWPDKGTGFLPKPDLTITITPRESGRQLKLLPQSRARRVVVRRFGIGIQIIDGVKVCAFARWLLSLGCCLLAMTVNAVAASQVKSVRLWRAPDNTRLVFDLIWPGAAQRLYPRRRLIAW